MTSDRNDDDDDDNVFCRQLRSQDPMCAYVCVFAASVDVVCQRCSMVV